MHGSASSAPLTWWPKARRSIAHQKTRPKSAYLSREEKSMNHLSDADKEFIVRVLGAHAAIINPFSLGNYIADSAMFSDVIRAAGSGRSSHALPAENDQRPESAHKTNQPSHLLI